MRVLIVGTVPPPGGPAAQQLAEVAAQRLAAGDEVEVISPNQLSAAHRHLRLDGLFLAIQLGLAAPRFDAVVLRVERSLPLRAETGRGLRAVYLAALGLALSRYGDVTLRLDSPIPLPGGLGGRATKLLWSSVTRIVVADAADERMALAVPGVRPEMIVVEHPLDIGHQALELWPSATDPKLRESVLDLVRARSARDRDVARARATLGARTSAPPSPAIQSADSTVHASVRGSAELFGRRLVRKARSLLSS